MTDKLEQEPVFQFKPDAENWIDCTKKWFDDWKGEKRVLYTSPPNAKAIRAAALMEAVEICDGLSKLYEREDVGFHKGYTMCAQRAMKTIQSLIDQ